jgi:hypothetical protein
VAYPWKGATLCIHFCLLVLLLLLLRSMVEGSTRNSSAMAVKQLAAKGAKGSGGGGKGRSITGSVIRATIPYVKADVPILVLFRALGTVVSNNILKVAAVLVLALAGIGALLQSRWRPQ